jgi:hypothetical protein
VSTEDAVKTIEADLRQLVETEVKRFAEHYTECQEASSIWTVEDLDVSIHDVMLHGLNCDYHNFIFVTKDQLIEIPEYLCWVTFEDPEHQLYRRLAHVKVLFIPSLNKCYIEKKIYHYDIREVAEHIARTGAEEDA